MSAKKFSFILITCILLYAFFLYGNTYVPIESLGIPSMVGADIKKGPNGNVEYEFQSSIYNYGNNKLNKDLILESTSGTIGKARGSRQLQEPAKYISGLEKVIVCSDAFSAYGLSNLIEILFSTETVTDTTMFAVCKGKTIDIVKFQIEGYSNPGDYLEGLLKGLEAHNFFSHNYKLMDIYMRLDSEGRNLVLPYIEIKDDKLQVTGMAIFKKDKLERVLDIEETRIMNLLRENNVFGNLSLNQSSDKYIDFYAKSSRKVKCSKEDDKYVFDIQINLSGNLVSNSMYDKLASTPGKIKEFEEAMSKSVEESCKEFLNKMQNEYKIDTLELGRVAAAKYGREKDVDWDKIVSNSTINVSVKTKINRFGRGDF